MSCARSFTPMRLQEGTCCRPQVQKKILFTYVSFQDIGNTIDEVSWLPFSAIPARDMAVVRGAILLRSFHAQKQQGILIGQRSLPLSLLAYVGDFDSIARSLGSLGAGALKPCCLCDNVLQRQSDVPERDPFFLSVGSSDVDKFRQIQQPDLEALFDSKVQSVHGAAARKKTETLLGYHLNEDGWLACRISTNLLPLSKIVFDSFHNYYASGGVANSECLLLQHNLAESHGIGIKDIQASVKQVDWFTWAENYKSRSARGHLFHAKYWDGDHFKGGASALYFLLPLYGYILQKLGLLDGTPQLASFQALWEAAQLKLMNLSLYVSLAP